VLIKRGLILISMTAASLVLAAASYAAVCSSNGGVLQASQWVQTGWSYTDQTGWNGDAGKGYTAERIADWGFAYFQNVDSGGFHFFNNGGFAPYRKSSFYNWYNNSNSATVTQSNTIGGC